MKNSLILGMLLVGAGSGFAAPVASLHVHSGAGTPGVFAQSLAPAAGAWVRFGYLAETFDPVKEGWNPSALAAAWTEFGETQVLGHRDGAGRFSATLASDAAHFAGKPVYLWIVQTSDGAKPRSDASNIVAHALVGSSSKNWRFPPAGALAPANAAILSTAEIDQAWFGVRTAGALTLDRSGMSYARWVGGAFDPSRPDVDTTWMADPDGDGVVNLLDYVFGSSPGQGRARHAVSVKQADAQRFLEVEYDVAPWRSDGAVVAEVSSDLETWTPIASSLVRRHADGSERRIARDDVPLGAESHRFIRLRAILQ